LWFSARGCHGVRAYNQCHSRPAIVLAAGAADDRHRDYLELIREAPGLGVRACSAAGAGGGGGWWAPAQYTEWADRLLP